MIIDIPASHAISKEIPTYFGASAKNTFKKRNKNKTVNTETLKKYLWMAASNIFSVNCLFLQRVSVVFTGEERC